MGKRKLLLLRFVCATLVIVGSHGRKSEDSDESEEGPNGNPAMDRLAVNLAGAFVKSIFPEMDREIAAASPAPSLPLDPFAISNENEIRRAPQNHAALLREAAGGPAFDSLSTLGSKYGFPAAIGPTGGSLGSLGGLGSALGGQQLPFPTQGGGFNPYAPSSMSFPAAGLAAGLPSGGLSELITGIPEHLNMNQGGIEAINAAKRQKYLAEMQNHQNALNDYSAKQLEYLDQQRRYQQAMVDQQAGAALLMQQQQQQYLTKMKQKYAGLDEVEPKITERAPGDQSTRGEQLKADRNPAKQLAARTEAHKAFDAAKHPEPREEFASDEYLRDFLKENFGINFRNDEEFNSLSEKDKQTLRELKEFLVREAQKDGLQVGAIKKMEKFNEARGEPPLTEGDNLEKELAELEADSCAQCTPISPKKLQGQWTQIYGNPGVMRETYSTIISLMRMNNMADISNATTKMTKKHASCVGMEVGKFRQGEAAVNYFFFDDSQKNNLYEMNGTLSITTSGVFKLSLDFYESSICMVKFGPTESQKADYIILTDITGSSKCNSYVVFARSSDEFESRHFDDVADFMKTSVLKGEALPIAALPQPARCELPH